MAKVTVELVKYAMDKTKKRKRSNFEVESKSEEAIVDKLEKIHKGEKVQAIHEIIWGEDVIDQSTNAERFTGRIKFFDDDKGFGFIQVDAEKDDLFFHVTALGGETIYDEDLVEFEISESPKGAVAIKIKLIS